MLLRSTLLSLLQNIGPEASRHPRTILLKLFIDQVIMTILSLAIFYVFIGQFERETVEGTKTELHQKFCQHT